MASLCSRCAIRARRAMASGRDVVPTIRAFSQTAAAQRGNIPTFSETSSSELNAVLHTIREKHFKFGYLPKREQKLLLNPANKQLLYDNPIVTTIGDEEFELKWYDRRAEIPSQRSLIDQAIDLMRDSERGIGFEEVPQLMIGMKGIRRQWSPQQIEMIVRKAVASGRAGVILQCIERPTETGMDIGDYRVANTFMTHLRLWVQREKFDRAVVTKALRELKHMASILQAQAAKRPNNYAMLRSSRLLGALLELAAVRAKICSDGKDVDGLVQQYAPALVHNFSLKDVPESSNPRSKGPQVDLIRCVPILNGLRLAQEILGQEAIPGAQPIVAKLQPVLSEMVEAIEETNPKEGTYGAQALDLWRQCMVPS